MTDGGAKTFLQKNWTPHWQSLRGRRLRDDIPCTAWQPWTTLRKRKLPQSELPTQSSECLWSTMKDWSQREWVLQRRGSRNTTRRLALRYYIIIGYNRVSFKLQWTLDKPKPSVPGHKVLDDELSVYRV